MRNLILGIVIGAIIAGQAAYAMDVSLSKFNIADFYCGLALCGYSTICIPANSAEFDRIAEAANIAGTKLAAKRGLK